MNFLLYDEFKLVSAFDFDIEQEVIFGSVTSFNLFKDGGPNPKEAEDRTLPLFNTLDMSEKAYSQLWDYMIARRKSWFNYFNYKVFANGIPLPYWNFSFITKQDFDGKALHMIIKLFYDDVQVEYIPDHQEPQEEF